MTSAANLKNVEAENYKSIQMLFRYLEISSFYNSMDGLLRAKFAYEGVNFRCVITPSENIPSSLYPLVSKFSNIQNFSNYILFNFYRTYLPNKLIKPLL